MADFVTSVADQAALVAWYGTVPANTGTDRYIARCAGGNYDLAGVTWTGKTVGVVGGITVSGAVGARPGDPNTNPARFESSGRATIRTSFNATNQFGCSLDGGFVFEDIQIAGVQVGTLNFGAGCLLQRCVTTKTSTSASMQLSGIARMRNCLSMSTVAAGVFAFAGSGSVTNNTFINFADFGALGLSGSFQNAVWQNNVAINLGGSTDPWSTPPSSFFAAGSSNNATNFGSAGNCPGTSVVFGVVPANAFVNVSSTAALNARPKAGSALLAVGVVTASTGGIDFYGDARGGSTVTIGAVELTSSPVPSDLSGSATLGDVSASGGMSGPSELSGTATLGDVTAAGTLASGGSILSGNATLGDVGASGTMSPAPGTLTLGPLKYKDGTRRRNETGIIVHVYALAGPLVVTKVGQATNASGVLPALQDGAIVPGNDYRVVPCTGDGWAGIRKVRAA